MTTRRKPGQRAGLTVTDVRQHARQMLTESGADGLTMRGLADRLDVSPNTLYSYTESKLALIDDVLDDVLADVTEPDAGDEPAAALLTIMRSTYDVLTKHRHLVPLYVQQQGARGPNAQRLGHSMLTFLARADITGETAARASHVLVVYAIGSAAYHTGTPTASDVGADMSEGANTAAFLDGLHWLLHGIGLEPSR